MKPIIYTHLINWNNAQTFQKKTTTLLRKPSPQELNTPLKTYVLHEGNLRIESENTITNQTIIACNPQCIGHILNKEIYNEWLIPQETVISNYGEILNQLSETYQPFRKQAFIKAIQLTPTLLQYLTNTPHATQLLIQVDWSPTPMIAKLNDYLTDKGYSISAHDMNQYEPL